MSTLLSRAEGVLSWSAWSWSACLKQGGSNLQHALDALGPFSIVKKTISFASYELLFAKLAPRWTADVEGPQVMKKREDFWAFLSLSVVDIFSASALPLL